MNPLELEDSPPLRNYDETTTQKLPSETQLRKNPRRLGRTYAFCYNRDGEPRIVIGPNYCFFICLNAVIWIFALSLLIVAATKGFYLFFALGLVILLL